MPFACASRRWSLTSANTPSRSWDCRTPPGEAGGRATDCARCARRNQSTSERKPIADRCGAGSQCGIGGHGAPGEGGASIRRSWGCSSAGLVGRRPRIGPLHRGRTGAVLKHDANATNPLLPTLRTYLNCDGNKSQAAQSLFVQRRTLYYRLERITTCSAARWMSRTPVRRSSSRSAATICCNARTVPDRTRLHLLAHHAHGHRRDFSRCGSRMGLELP